MLRSISLLALILAPAALADDSSLDSLFTPRLELPDAARRVPAVISPAGNQVAYAAGKRGSFELRVATLVDGGTLKLRTVHTFSEGLIDDVLAASLQPGCWSHDSRYLSAVVCRDGDPKQLIACYFDLQTGERVDLSPEGTLGVEVRFHPAEGSVAWIEGSMQPLASRALVRELKSGKVTPLARPREEFVPALQRYLPDGRRVVLNVVIVDGEAKQLLTVESPDGTHVQYSEEVRSSSTFWNEVPILLLTDTSRFYVESRAEHGQVRLLSFDLQSDASRQAVAASDYAFVSLIDAGRACVYSRDGGGAIRDLKTGKLTPLGHSRVLVHRRGERTVILDVKTNTLHVN